VTPKDVEVIKAAGIAPAAFDPLVPSTYTQLLEATRRLTGFRAAANHAALRAIAGTTAHAVATLCRATAGDGGQGMWSWDAASVAADDDVLVVMPTGQVGAGRWVRYDVRRNELAAPLGASQIGSQADGAGTVLRTVAAKLGDFKSLNDFDVVGDGVADDTAAIQAALTYCEVNDVKLMGDAGTYRVTSTLVINCNADLSLMLVTANAATVSPVIRVGPNAAAQYLFDADIQLPFISNSAKLGIGWVGFDSSLGLEVANTYQSRVVVKSVRGFGVGMQVGGYGVGCAYNTFTIGLLFDNKINQRLRPGDADGWSNQNTYIGGRYGHSSSEGSLVSGVRHIQLRDFDGTGPGAPNNNVWLNPSIEGNEPEFHLDIQGSFNTFINPRLEVPVVSARVNYHAETTNETVNNNLVGGYDISGVEFTLSGAGTCTRNKRLGGTASDVLEYSGSGLILGNRTGSGRLNAHVQGFLSTAIAIEKNGASTDWIYRLHGNGYSLKSAADTEDRIQLTAGGYLYFGRGSAAPTAGFRAGSAGEIQAQSILQPETDNILTLGAAAKRWSVVYAATGAINTSDERDKQQWSAITEAEKRVAVRAKALLKCFKFTDAVLAKGTGARIHFGIGAQSLKAAFESEGLVAEKYAVICHDVWPDEYDESGKVLTPAGERYGVRYDELLAFIIAAL
jgi:hypothetical protein